MKSVGNHESRMCGQIAFTNDEFRFAKNNFVATKFDYKNILFLSHYYDMKYEKYINRAELISKTYSS